MSTSFPPPSHPRPSSPTASSSSSRPLKRAKVDHESSREGTPASLGPGHLVRSFSQREDDGDEREPEYVGDPANIEQHRKEALYLSLLSSKRQLVRSQQKSRELENQVHDLKSGVIVIENLWRHVTQLLESAAQGRSEPISIRKENLEGHDHDTEMSDLIESLKDPTLGKQLEARLPHLQTTIDRLFPPSSTSSSVSPSSRQLPSFSISTSLESAIQALRTERDDLQEKYASAMSEFDTVKRKCDRWKLEYERVKASSGEQEPHQREASAKPASREPSQGADGRRMLQEQGEKAVASSSTVTGTNGVAVAVISSPIAGNEPGNTPITDPTTAQSQILTAANDHENLLTRLKSRESEIDRLENEKQKLASEMDFLREVAWNPTEESVLASAVFKTLKAEFEEFKSRNEESKRTSEVNEKRAESLSVAQEGFKAALEYSYNQKFESLDRLIRTKDADVARLRGQRDAIREENDLLKGEKQVVFESIKESDALVAAAEERLKAVHSELERLRTRTAAEAGEKGYLGFLLNVNETKLDYIRSLEAQIAQSSDREKALQEQVRSHMQHPGSIEVTHLVESESKARESAETYKRLLEEREAIAKSDAPQAELVNKLESKQTEITRLQGVIQEREAATMTLYSEVENLSKAYEQMEKMAKKKVADTRALENQALEAMTVKAKAEHKYFAECRRSSALLDQQQAIHKTLEAQRVALDKSRTVEDELRAQLAAQEKEMSVLKSKFSIASSRVQRLETEVVKLQSEAEESARRAEGRENINKERLEEIKTMQMENRQLKSEVEETKAKLKQNAAMLKSTQAKGVSVGEVALQKERDMLFGILRCTACHLRFKTKILSTCLHTFCDECITARLTNRNRKCITCMRPFAESDVKNLF